jgi:hypothetical protein
VERQKTGPGRQTDEESPQEILETRLINSRAVSRQNKDREVGTIQVLNPRQSSFLSTIEPTQSSVRAFHARAALLDSWDSTQTSYVC